MPVELNSTDRCDGCGVQAWARVRVPSGRELLLCGHHFAQHEAKLREADATWVDERHRINAVLDVSPA